MTAKEILLAYVRDLDEDACLDWCIEIGLIEPEQHERFVDDGEND